MLPRIKHIIREVKHWPDSKPEHYLVQKIGTRKKKDGKGDEFHYYEATMSKAKVAVVQKLQQLEGKLTRNEVDSLWKLIYAYGDRKI